MNGLQIEPGRSMNLEPCSRCGRHSVCVWGFAYDASGPFGAYYVRWTPGHLRSAGADISLVLGRWGEGTDAGDRCVVSAIYRISESGRGFMLVDAKDTPGNFSSLASTSSTRAELLGTPLADQSFRFIDAVFEQDDRLGEFGQADVEDGCKRGPKPN